MIADLNQEIDIAVETAILVFLHKQSPNKNCKLGFLETETLVKRPWQSY